jgi:8-oxo-dGTP pyrophosphatase MutT (NUDIX family)
MMGIELNDAAGRIIRISAALVLRADGYALLVRKRGTSAFMQPGGKIERDEGRIQTLIRELREELSLAILPSQPIYLGRFMAPAANEPGFTVDAELYKVETDADIIQAAEIEELAWVKPGGPTGLELAPLTRDHVLPIHAKLFENRLR